MLPRRPVRHPVPSVAQIVWCTSSGDGRLDVYDGTADGCIGVAYVGLADLVMPAQARGIAGVDTALRRYEADRYGAFEQFVVAG